VLDVVVEDAVVEDVGCEIVVVVAASPLAQETAATAKAIKNVRRRII
jgi:hypothetical protein